MLVRELFKIKDALWENNVQKDDFICGVEYEIESVNTDVELFTEKCPFVSWEIDNSLRNHGFEFKTAPATKEQQLSWNEELFSKLEYGEDAFSSRTSIHIHVNVRNLSEHQCKEMILLYAMLEPLFMNFVGKERESSIYCVPLNYTYLPTKYNLPLVELRRSWHKYTALNILPLCKDELYLHGLGTIEFRHLFGTDNPEIFFKWISTLESLFYWAQSLREDQKAIHMLQDLEYFVFKTFPYLPVPTKDMLKDSILDVKLSEIV